MSDTNPVVTSESVGILLCKALGIDPDKAQRIVIDVQAGEITPPTVYVQMVGDQRLLEVGWDVLLSKMDIQFSDTEPGEVRRK